MDDEQRRKICEQVSRYIEENPGARLGKANLHLYVEPTDSVPIKMIWLKRDRKELRDEILELREQGLTFRQISEILGPSIQYVFFVCHGLHWSCRL